MSNPPLTASDCRSASVQPLSNSVDRIGSQLNANTSTPNRVLMESRWLMSRFAMPAPGVPRAFCSDGPLSIGEQSRSAGSSLADAKLPPIQNPSNRPPGSPAVASAADQARRYARNPSQILALVADFAYLGARTNVFSTSSIVAGYRPAGRCPSALKSGMDIVQLWREQDLLRRRDRRGQLSLELAL